MKKLLLIIFLFGCSGMVEDPHAFAARESGFRSLQIIGCLADRPQPFTTCYGRAGEAVKSQLRLILPPLESSVEIFCGGRSLEFTARETAIVDLAMLYGDTWDLDQTCVMSIMVTTRLADQIVHYEANVLVYAYGRGFIPAAPDNVMAWECSVKYSTKGRVSVKCGRN